MISAFKEHPQRIVAAVLSIIGALLVGISWEANKPWKDRDLLKPVAMRLDVEREAVPKEVFFDPPKLGELNLGVDFYQQWGFWWSGWIVGGALLFLGATAPFWWKWTRITQKQTQKLGTHLKKWDLAILGIGLILSLFLRVPHLDRALYFDEQDNLRRNFHGYFETTAGSTEEPKWKPANWNAAFFENRLGNNPVFYSVMAQTSHTIWRATTGAERERFSVVAMRVPALICGMLSLAAIWWLLQLWGFRWAAPIALFWGAIHAMHIDYSIQARGYGVVMLCVPLMLGFGTLAIRDPRWRWWLGLAFATFFCLWSYAASIYAAFLINAGILACSIRQKDVAMMTRQIAASILVALIYIWLMAPHYPQLAHHFGQVFEMIPLKPEWMTNAWSHYATGTNFPTGPEIGAIRSGAMTLDHALWKRFLPNEAFLATTNWLIVPLLLALGLLWLWKRRETRLAAWLITLGIAAPLLALFHQRLTFLYLYYWYLIYGLPVMLIIMAIAIEKLRGDAPSKKRTLIWSAAVAAFLAALAWKSSPWSSGDPEGRVARDTEWLTEPDSGREFVEFKRARHQWLAYHDGYHLSIREAFLPDGTPRAGRD